MRYIAALPVAAVLFMALAIVDEREVFLSALGEPEGPVAPAGPKSIPEAERAVSAVRALTGALETGYREASAEPLAALALADELREELALELRGPRGQEEASGLALLDFELLGVEPAGEGSWSLNTDETWVASATGERHRLRFRYRLVESAGALSIDEMVPILPEIERAASP